MKSSEILNEAYKLLSRPKGWCKGSYAKNVAGELTYPQSPYAVSFCSAGAIKHCAKADYAKECAARGYLIRVISPRGPYDGVSIGDWNDKKSRTKKQVLNAFDKAIALAKKTEKK